MRSWRFFFACGRWRSGRRLAWLQVVQHQEWVSRAAKQQTGAFEVAPRRGVLYDRNLKELAMTVLVDSVYAVPSELGENRAEAAQMLARVVHVGPNGSLHERAPDAGAVQRVTQGLHGLPGGLIRRRRTGSVS